MALAAAARCSGGELRGFVRAHKTDGAAQDQPISFEEDTGTLSMCWTVGDGCIKVRYLNNRRFNDEREHPTYHARLKG
jgi:hypothetical protein